MSSSRKRSSRQSKMSLFSDHSVSNANECDSYEYYRPGCYFTPQVVVEETSPCSCSYLHQCPVQWLCCNAATYVVDAYGMVYYLSDFQNQLQQPNSITVDEKVFYPYHYVANEYDDTDDEADVSPRKRERFDELENDADSREPIRRIPFSTNKKSEPVLQADSTIYRAPQGYLVEEPAD